MEYRWSKNVSDHCDYIIYILKILCHSLQSPAQPQLAWCIVKTSDTVQIKRKQTKPNQGLPTYWRANICMFANTPREWRVRLRGLDHGPTQQALLKPMVDGGETRGDATAHQWVPLMRPWGQRRLPLSVDSDLSLGHLEV